jgi:hypothetical protein
MSGSALRLKQDPAAHQTAPPPVPPAIPQPAPFPVAPQQVAQPAPVGAASSHPAFAGPAAPQPVRSEAGRSLARAWIEGTIAFFVAASFLIGLQVLGRFQADNIWWYTAVSLTLGGLMAGIIILKAFFDTFTQGLIIISIPAAILISFMVMAKEVTAMSLGMWIVSSLAWFYYPYYIFVRMERSPVIKGIYAAMLVAALLEWPLLGDETLTGRAISDLVEAVRDMR